tara:strand:+ start:1148 stop:1336 length:189 start_codon:yes stop_codon:yes gene_type:complete
MTIFKNPKYQKAPLDNPDNKNTDVVTEIDGVQWTIPIDENNRHYAEILKQVTDGDLTIADAD